MDEDQGRFFREAVRGTEVHTIHAEVEGRLKLHLFGQILDGWIAAGVALITLEELANEILGRRAEVPTRPLARARLPGRGGEVSTGWPRHMEP
jgi:hypothetical protein